MPINLFRAAIVWGLHGGTFTNRVGIIADGPDPSSVDALAGLISAVAPPMLEAISEQVSLVGIDVKCLNDKTKEPASFRFNDVIGQRTGQSYTTHDQYKVRLYTDTRLFRTGGKLVLGCAEGDVTDSAVDTDMPTLLDAIGQAFAQGWFVDSVAYANVLFRPDRETGPWDFDYITAGAYSHIGTAGMRKLFRLGAYAENTRVDKVLTSGNGTWGDLNQDPALGITYQPVDTLIGTSLPATGTLNNDGTYVQYV